jgi:GTP-binding protein
MGSETFVDEATITVSSGAGGAGRVGFRREKFVPRGGPNGGDGGAGGNVTLVADRNENTLLSFRARRKFKARDGASGGSQEATGADGASVEIRVPVGTMVFGVRAEASPPTSPRAQEDETPLVDLAEHGQRFVVARGGRGGRGNARFKTSTRQTPDFAQGGLPGETWTLDLSLKLLADVGLVGFPNAGKSTLIRAISAAKPRVASYPFTTLVPSLGVVELDDRRFVVADIPGLIEGASEGVGLGDRFLRHVERTRVLVHLLDLGAMRLEGRNLLEDYDALRKELGRYRPELLERREIVLLNKIDLVPEDEMADVNSIAAALAAGGSVVLRGSGATREGTQELVVAMLRTLDEVDREAEERESADGEAGRGAAS